MRQFEPRRLITLKELVTLGGVAYLGGQMLKSTLISVVLARQQIEMAVK